MSTCCGRRRERTVDSGGTSIGYSVGVIFPLRIVPQEVGKPVTLRLRLQYAICEKLCVPAEARSELTLASGRVSQDAALTAAEGRVPKRANLGEAGDLSIRSVRRERGTGDKERVVVDVAGPSGVDLFVEGPNQQWALPVPTPVDRGAARTAAFRVRSRRRSNRRELPGRVAEADGRRARPVDRGLDPSRLIRPRR